MDKSKLLIFFLNILSFGRWDISPRLSYLQTHNYNCGLFQPEAKYFIPGHDKQQFTGQLNLRYHL